MKIVDLPKEDRPREKAKSFGITCLSNSELLALILGSGFKGMNVIELSQFILNKFSDLESLFSSNYETLKIKGLSNAKKYRLLATFELCKRVYRPTISLSKNSVQPFDLVEYFKSLNLDKENVVILIYSKKGKLITKKILYTGTQFNVSISPSEIIKEVNIVNGYSFILIHNHPSNIVEPSIADIQVTKKLLELSIEMNIKFIDHYIVGTDSYFSFLNNKKTRQCLVKIKN